MIVLITSMMATGKIRAIIGQKSNIRSKATSRLLMITKSHCQIESGDDHVYKLINEWNYNSRGLPNELLINEDKYSIIHAEEKTSDIIARDLIPDWL